MSAIVVPPLVCLLFNVIIITFLWISSSILCLFKRQLKTNLRPLEKYTFEHSIIEKYLQNTHAKEHNKFRLEIEHVFSVEREGEAQRHADPRDLHGNVHLLWHGSRLCNWTGILSQGLRIAPPEAPVSGYFLGKGIYLADVVSK